MTRKWCVSGTYVPLTRSVRKWSTRLFFHNFSSYFLVGREGRAFFVEFAFESLKAESRDGLVEDFSGLRAHMTSYALLQRVNKHDLIKTL